MAKILHFLFSLYAFTVFLLLMLILFPFVLIAGFFGRIKGGNIIYGICRLWADICLFLWGIRHKNIYEAPIESNHAVVYIFNHISYLDIPLLLKVFRKQKIRILGKAEMAKIPIFGYIYSKAVVMVNRDSADNRARSIAQLKAILRKNISIVIAPEGTFNMTGKPLKEFYNGAFRIAIETNTAIQPVLFLDAHARLPYEFLFSLNPGRSRAVYLPQIPADNYTLADIEIFKEKVYRAMEEKLISYQVDWIKNEA